MGTSAACLAVLLAALALPAAAPADAATVEAVTARGNVFQLGAAGAAPADAGRSMADGLGITSRMIHGEYSGLLIHGTGGRGSHGSILPYHDIGPGAGFAAAVLEGDPAVPLHVPSLYGEYLHEGGSLVPAPGSSPPSILGHSGYRATSGDAHVAGISGGGIAVAGDGTVLVRLEGHGGAGLLVRGSVPPGGSLRLVGSPYDLVSSEHLPGRGFAIFGCACGSGGLEAAAVAVGSEPDSAPVARIDYANEWQMRAYGNYGLHYGHYRTHWGSEEAHAYSGVSLLAGEGGYKRAGRVLEWPEPLDDESIYSRYDLEGDGISRKRVESSTVVLGSLTLYDPMPARGIASFGPGPFEGVAAFGNDTAYMVAQPAGGTILLHGSAAAGRDVLRVSGLPPDTPFVLESASGTLAAGTTLGGTVLLGAAPGGGLPAGGAGGTLWLYPESLTAVGGFGNMTVLDHRNSRVLHAPGAPGTLYNAHAYVKVPIPGAAEISGVRTEGADLGYLDGTYAAGESVLVPVIPGHKAILMEINGAPASLALADVPGAAGVRILGEISGTVSIHRPGAFTESVAATAGAVGGIVAPADGTARAHVQATVSGASEITNTRTFVDADPPPPPPPRPRDPLEAWVEAYVNGIRVPGRTQLFFSDAPSESHESGGGTYHAYHTARFSYPEVTVHGTVSVPVSEGDYVEFYFYARVEAEGSVPPVPTGFAEHGRSSAASAAATVRHASIIAGT